MSYLPYDGGDEYTDPDGAGLDGAGGGGGHSDWPENRKLKAIRNVKAKATQARTDLTEGWTMSTQTIPSAMGSGDSITVEGGGTAESLKTALSEEMWDSPAAEDYRTRATEGIDSIATVIDTLIEDLTTAETKQKYDPGERAEPGSAEAVWNAED
mgnify:FL=1